MRCVVGGLVAALTAGALLGVAPPASAGCAPGAPFAVSKCDGPVQPDGTWQRCVTFGRTGVSQPSYVTDTDCQRLGPDQHPSGLAFTDPPTHIDD